MSCRLFFVAWAGNPRSAIRDMSDMADAATPSARIVSHPTLSSEIVSPPPPTLSSEIVSVGGVECYLWTWLPQGGGGAIKGLVLLFHGLGAHARFPSVRVAAEALARGGFIVCAPDFPGHGLSGGQRGFIHSAEQLERDALIFVEAARQAHPQLPLFLAGSSMGGAIAFQAALELDDQVRGLVLLAPMLAPAASAGAQVLEHSLESRAQLCQANYPPVPKWCSRAGATRRPRIHTARPPGADSLVGHQQREAAQRDLTGPGACGHPLLQRPTRCSGLPSGPERRGLGACMSRRGCGGAPCTCLPSPIPPVRGAAGSMRAPRCGGRWSGTLTPTRAGCVSARSPRRSL